MARVWPVKWWDFCELLGLVYTPVWLVGGGIAKPSYVGSNPIHASESYVSVLLEDFVADLTL